ncbi:PAS domain-containing hybrid sensor histidine kinase/response regulator [Pararhodospirillum photometricum]|uniref:histidine kinase n=1 Tax=Pararhodospirillum photometricum DSM 122 TaxID=1150469 RepID=H6SRE0_PARPM|nr:ATP-binding protein [Pararhodospirillum photometricum]CCG07469.1 Sensor protein [Pararhodospirillum photometricum DSM 122]
MALDVPPLIAALLDSLDDDVTVVDQSARVVFANARARQRLSSAPPGPETLITGLSDTAGQARYAALARVGACGVAETLEDQSDGRWWSVRFTPLPEGLVAVRARDITEARDLSLALADSEERLHSTFDAAGHGMALLGQDGRFWQVNRAMTTLLGLAPDALGTLDDVVMPDDREIARDLLRRLRAGPDTALTVRLRFRGAQGEPLWGEVGAAIPRHRPGDAPGVVLHLRDVTEEHRVDERLRAAKEEAERTSRAKTRFLAAASHDLRQPLQALAMFIAVLARRETDPRQAALIERIEKTTEALTGLLNTLLDISRLDAGLMRCEARDTPVGPLLARLAEEFQPVATGRGLALRLVPTSAHGHADPALVEIIVRNLLGNAVRYTRVGHVLLGVRRRPRGRVEIQVLDSGPGIPRDQHALVFEDFYQVDNPAREKGEGLGLGLSIVRRVASLLGAEVSLASVPGRGSRFSLVLAAAHGVAPDERGSGLLGADPKAAHGLTVMLIDDDPTILDGLTLVLEGWDCEVLAFGDLGHLLEGLESGGLLTPPDVIIADYRLGGGATGVDAVAMIRAAVGLPIPALLLTGDTAPQRLREADASGLPLLHKPVKPDALRAALADLMAGGLTLEEEDTSDPWLL